MAKDTNLLKCPVMELECESFDHPIIQFGDRDLKVFSCQDFGRPSIRFMRDTSLPASDPRYWICVDFDCRCTRLKPSDFHDLMMIVFNDFRKWFMNNRSSSDCSDQLEFDYGLL